MHSDRVTAARHALPEEGVLSAVVGDFRLLSDPIRVRILLALRARDLCVCDLAALLGLPAMETLRHLRRLRIAGAVDFRVDGKAAYYGLAGPSWPRLVAKAISEAEEREAGHRPHASAEGQP